MNTDLLLHIPLGLLPVLLFLVGLVYLDSYKLVSLRLVVIVIVAGVLAAVASYFMVLDSLDRVAHTRYVAPVIEEALKGLILVYLIRTDRVGFPVDAAIFGFAAGTGFAFAENIYYLYLLPDPHVGVWVVRGLGTAIMHGGATAMFAMISDALMERYPRSRLLVFVPGLLVATLTHSLFNHFFLPPVVSTVAILLVVPPLIYFAYRYSEHSLQRWLGSGFDEDVELLELINSGEFAGSNVGRDLEQLRDKFSAETIVDLLCYLRLHMELSLRAKGMLMMRESGFAIPPGKHTAEKFTELKYLENSIGKTGLMALRPFLHTSGKDLWQLYALESETQTNEQER